MLASLLRHIVPERFRPIGYLTNLTRRRTGTTVLTGPFMGMRYIERAEGSAYLPKLLGIYERELTPQVENLIARKPKLLVDLGAAEGYYAIGLARRLPEARVVAFEMEAKAREALGAMAAINGVADRIEIRAKCDAANLAEVLGSGEGSAVICDVEGSESELMDPEAVPGLRKAAILVELHDFLVPGVRELLRTRFEESHALELVEQQPRSHEEFPWRTLVTALLPKFYLDWAVSEWRPVVMQWFSIVPHPHR